MSNRTFRRREPPERAVHHRVVAPLLIVLALGMIAIEQGMREPVLPVWLGGVLQVGCGWLALVSIGQIRWRLLSGGRWRSRAGLLGEAMLAFAAVMVVVGAPAVTAGVTGLIAAVCAFSVFSWFAKSLRDPSLLFPASFLLLIVISAAMLKLPAATPAGQPISTTDALFTAASAVCVTGLSVRDTLTGFTPMGQGVIAASIQLGGLGFMIFGSTLWMLVGARLSMRDNMTLSMAMDEYPVERIARFVGFIVLTTLTIELVGAMVMFLSWPEDDALSVGGRIWASVFHSVSAFCNAGFDITGESLVGVRGHAVTLIGFLPMIVLGGLGFVVLEDLARIARGRSDQPGKRVGLTTHSKLVIATTAGLLIVGAVGIFVCQLAAVGEARGVGEGIADAVFMSATARTAGFTVMPMEDLSPGSQFVLMLLMLIGGSPGSTAGGMKTTVFVLLALAVVATIRGRDEVEVFKRAIPDALVKKASTIAFGLLLVVALSTIGLSLTNAMPLEPLLFEAISAATTTGLSLGITGDLSEEGRWIVIVTMFLGRVGPLAAAAALVARSGQGVAFRYPRDSVSLG